MAKLTIVLLALILPCVCAYQSCTTGSFPDIVLVVEDSNQIPTTNELQLRSFLAEIANNFNLGTDTSRIAYQLYNATQTTVFNLNKYDETTDARSAILSQTFARAEVTPTAVIANALTYTWTNMLTVTNGERSCHPTVVILVSFSSYPDPNGGFGAADPMLIANDLSAVRRLKNSGALIITIGVGPGRNPLHLLELSSGPQYYHDYSSFGLLTGSEADVIAAQTCGYMPDGNFYPCEMRAVQADFVFVVDVSANFANNAQLRPTIVNFMNNTLSPYNFDHSIGVQAALVTYQKDADVQINFHDFDDLPRFLSEADVALQRSCGDYTQRCVDNALDQIINHVFTPNQGYRPTCTIHQIYIFTSDCFNCGDPIPRANVLRTGPGFPNTEIYVVPLIYGLQNNGFWKEYLEIADDASHLWEVQPDPVPIVTEYLHKQAWRSVCRAFDPVRCSLSPPTTVRPTTTTTATYLPPTTPTTSPEPATTSTPPTTPTTSPEPTTTPTTTTEPTTISSTTSTLPPTPSTQFILSSTTQTTTPTTTTITFPPFSTTSVASILKRWRIPVGPAMD